MGWHINLEKNTVKIDSGIALALYDCGADVCFAWRDECDFPMLGGIIYDGKLVFNSDHMEHMDYVWQPEVLAVLKKHRVTGDVCFSSNDGDNRGRRWGYRFFVDDDGVGRMVELKGQARSWVEASKKRSKKAVKKAAKVKPHPKNPLAEVRARVETEGFDYAFRHYSDFSQVKSKRFHVLRKAYVKAAKALEMFIEE